MSSRILAIDLGTSSTKGLLVENGGEIVASHAVEYALRAPRPGYAEQDATEIAAAAEAVIARLAPFGVDLVFSSAMHSLLAVDAAGAPLTPVQTWADRRSAAQAHELRRGASGEGLHTRTGTPLHPMSPLCKLRHMARHDAATFAAADRFVSAKEFVIEALTGARCVDHSVASASGLFDVARLEWDGEALELAGIDASRLSPPVPTTHVIEDPRHDRSVVVGATDGVLANLGVGAVDGRTPCITLGTSGAARLVVDRPRTDPSGRLFCYVLDAGQWVVGGAINNGGIVVRWLRDLFAVPDASEVYSEDALIATAAEAPAGSAGLLCVPRLTGERYPDYSAEGTGSLLGLTLAHRRCHVLRAGIEGVMLSLAPLVDELSIGGEQFAEVRIGGGVFEWAFCRQMLSDVLGRRVAMPASRESSALGAARLGFKAMGEEHDWPVLLPSVHEPATAAFEVYRQLRERRSTVVS